ncbi:MAG: PLP-dependent aminotransferase family protein [Candidatus Obscuribacterales bacterium]|nr:PLP-dependent aminotransferase family protein [Candidatus Obscuribacterales bacterium]
MTPLLGGAFDTIFCMDFALELEYKPYVPLYRRISDGLRKAIFDGRLRPGEPMPSIRDLSETLHISRSTVLKAFEDLTSQGLVESVQGAGTFVAAVLPGAFGNTILEPVAPSSVGRQDNRELSLGYLGSRLAMNIDNLESVHSPQINFGGVPIELAPLKIWKQLLLKYAREENLPARESFDPFGYIPLREALSSYLNRTRSVQADASRVVLFGTKQGRLDLVSRLIIDPGDNVAYENPGYPESRQVLSWYGANIVPISVDSDGLCVDEVISSSLQFKAVYVTPSHQDPVGVSLSMDRRMRLLEWAKRRNVLIIEDDYDSEYRYGTASLPSLQGLDTGDRVIFLSSFWKVLYQSVRLGYMVIPDCLTNVMKRAKTHTEKLLPLPEQLALADFVNDGHLERFLHKSQSLYAIHRQRLFLSLTRHMRDYLEIAPVSGGTHTLVTISSRLSDDELVKLAAKADVQIMSTESYYIDGQGRKGEFMMPFVVSDSEEIEEKIKNWSYLIRHSDILN